MKPIGGVGANVCPKTKEIWPKSRTKRKSFFIIAVFMVKCKKTDRIVKGYIVRHRSSLFYPIDKAYLADESKAGVLNNPKSLKAIHTGESVIRSLTFSVSTGLDNLISLLAPTPVAVAICCHAPLCH